MFYDIKEKTVESSQTRWWLTAALSAVLISLAFLGMTFWLGMTSRTEFERSEKFRDSFREFDFRPAAPIPNRMMEQPTTTTAKTEFSTAEILKTVIKSKKAKVEMVTGENSKKSLEGLEDARAGLSLDPKEERIPPPEISVSSVRKKSEALPPSWFDPRLEASASASSASPSEPADNLVKDAVYELPDFSNIQPDLSTFNTKTIPAFTYLRNPLPDFEPESDKEEEEEDDEMYYKEAPRPDSPLLSFLQRRAQELQDWLLYGTRKNRTDVSDIVKAINDSIQSKSIGALLHKMKDFYVGFNATDLQNLPVANLLYPSMASGTSVIGNSSSLVSFGLLAIDLFLLHNVQQIVWNEEGKIGEEMLQDPDVIAMNALFMAPERIRKMRLSNSRILQEEKETGKSGILHEIIEFVNSGLRAVVNLSRAYKNSARNNNARSSGGTTLDCIWTLYCRNLDKTAKLHGPYGFLAKMNSLGLRLMMGEFPVDKVLEKLAKEYNSGWGVLDCNKLFPRCSAEEAKEIVMQTAMGRN